MILITVQIILRGSTLSEMLAGAVFHPYAADAQNWPSFCLAEPEHENTDDTPVLVRQAAITMHPHS